MMAMTVDFSVLEQFCELLGEEGKSEAVALVQLYLDDAPLQIENLKSGLRDNDPECFRRAAHSFKSSSANIGAFGLQALCQQMETESTKGVLEGMDIKLETLIENFNKVRDELKKWASD